MLTSFPAVFALDEYGYSVVFPDLNFLATEGKTYEEAMRMAVECLAGHIFDLQQHSEPIPHPSRIDQLDIEEGESPVVISVDVDVYAKEHFEKAVKKTLSIPKWLNDAAVAQGIKFSKVLQKALKEELGIVE
ncbi:type II toxin-antitoxin system HicB family antitoxin [Erysipelotrichaceae bacterium 51-3]